MITGLGTDIIEIERIEQALERHSQAFLDRVFTPAEQAYCQQQAHPARHYAGRWAAKEAISKALGTGISGHLGWHDMEILRDEAGRPHVTMTESCGHAAAIIHISISHSKHYATATAVVER